MVIGAAILLLLVCQLTDHTPRTIARQLEVVISKRAERRMLHKFGLPDLAVRDPGAEPARNRS